MNAAPAVFGDFVYVGSRTDASLGHPHPGVLIVDASDPEAPAVSGEIGPPSAGNVGETSRELRVWPQRSLLMVLNFGCERALHACSESPVEATIRFYDLTDPGSPRLRSEYRPSTTPHEMYLWIDPTRPGRALLFLTTFEASGPDLIVTDISEATSGSFSEIVRWEGAAFGARALPAPALLHSLALSEDSRRAYLAYWGGGILVLDVSEVTDGRPDPQVRLVTTVESRARWPRAMAHSAVPLPGTSFVLATDEVYSPCPWGWGHTIDVSDERRPRFVAELRTEENRAGFCDRPGLRGNSYSSHNPTVIGDLALITWHSGGLRAFSMRDPSHPSQSALFIPDPLPTVATEDPALSLGASKVVMWSYPIVSDGLIYLVDVRNGLYILRYRGPGGDEVSATGFSEGNSNVGFEKVEAAPPSPVPTEIGPTAVVPAGDGDREPTFLLWLGVVLIGGVVAGVLISVLRRC